MELLKEFTNFSTNKSIIRLIFYKIQICTRKIQVSITWYLRVTEKMYFIPYTKSITPLIGQRIKMILNSITLYLRFMEYIFLIYAKLVDFLKFNFRNLHTGRVRLPRPLCLTIYFNNLMHNKAKKLNIIFHLIF